MEDNQSERRLTEALTEDQFAEIVRELSGPLVLYARQFCRHPEDVVQEALLSLRHESVTPTNIRSWLFRVVRHRALNNLRGEDRRRKYEAEFGRECEAWFESPAELLLDLNDAVAALQNLPDQERETVVARLWGGLTLNEIASLMNTSLPTAQRRYLRGLKKLRAAKLESPAGEVKNAREEAVRSTAPVVNDVFAEVPSSWRERLQGVGLNVPSSADSQHVVDIEPSRLRYAFQRRQLIENLRGTIQ